MSPEEHPRGRAPAIPGVLAFTIPFVAYLLTLAPTVTLEDSGEFITAAYWLGVPHAPGYPLWCLAAHPFTWLPWGTVAERVHLACAVFGALGAWLGYLCAWRLVRDAWAALVGALTLGLSAILWAQSVVAEVYSLNVLLVLFLLYAALVFRDTRSPVCLYVLAFTVGLGMTNHFLIALAALPLFVWLLAIDSRAVLRPSVVLAGALLFVLGISIYLYLPLRASAEPPVNIGQTSSVSGAITHIARSVYSESTEAGRSAGESSDVLRHSLESWRGVASAFGWPAAALALLGLVAWPRGTRDVLWMTLGIALLNTVLLNGLMTAPYTPYWVYMHRVFYLPAHAMVGIWVAVGAHVLLDRTRRVPAIVGPAVLAFVVLWTGWASYPTAHRQDDRVAHLLALDVLDSAPEGAGFFPAGDDVIYPILHARWVEGLRPDVNLISKQYGWRGEPYSILLAGDPLTDQMREDLPALRDFVSVPVGVVYALVPSAAARDVTYASFVPLPNPPRYGPETARMEIGDLFEDAVRARYAAYHVRAGAKKLALGDRAGGLDELRRAETLDPGDAYVEVLLFRVYRDFGIHPERLRPLLERARESYAAHYDPHGSRYYPIDLDDIEAHLRELKGS